MVKWPMISPTTSSKKNYVDLLGTDLHHDRHLHALRSSPQLADIAKQLLDAGKLLNPSISF